MLLPEVRIGLTPNEFAALAAGGVPTEAAAADGVTWTTSTRRGCRWPSTPACSARCWPTGARATFGELVAGCAATLEVVARFLGLLNLYRESAVAFDQPEPLGELTIRWTGRVPAEAPTVDDEEYE